MTLVKGKELPRLLISSLDILEREIQKYPTSDLRCMPLEKVKWDFFLLLLGSQNWWEAFQSTVYTVPWPRTWPTTSNQLFKSLLPLTALPLIMAAAKERHHHPCHRFQDTPYKPSPANLKEKQGAREETVMPTTLSCWPPVHAQSSGFPEVRSGNGFWATKWWVYKTSANTKADWAFQPN